MLIRAETVVWLSQSDSDFSSSGAAMLAIDGAVLAVSCDCCCAPNSLSWVELAA